MTSGPQLWTLVVRCWPADRKSSAGKATAESGWQLRWGLEGLSWGNRDWKQLQGIPGILLNSGWTSAVSLRQEGWGGGPEPKLQVLCPASATERPHSRTKQPQSFGKDGLHGCSLLGDVPWVPITMPLVSTSCLPEALHRAGGEWYPIPDSC